MRPWPFLVVIPWTILIRLWHRNNSVGALSILHSLSTTMAVQRRLEKQRQEEWQQIRYAAGDDSDSNVDCRLGQLVKELGWTAADLDNMAATKDGGYKGAIHMAAWRGSIANIAYLLQAGCDINLVSQGPYSYGKTPLFFAMTRSRQDVVEYLLLQKAKVKIVNNKGQTVLSLASSHVPTETICRIQETEEAQQHQPWTNYRATHSDDCEYGDLDPRFLDRCVRATDVVHTLVINPTTKESRKGGFARLNPTATTWVDASKASEKVSSRGREERSMKKRDIQNATPLTLQEKQQREACWATIQHLLSGTDERDSLVGDIVFPLTTIVQMRDKQKMCWMREEAERLELTLLAADGVESEGEGSAWSVSDIKEWAARLKDHKTATGRHVSLVRRLLTTTIISQSVLQEPGAELIFQEKIAKRATRVPAELLLPAQMAVRGLSMSLLQTNAGANDNVSERRLCLPFQATWIDSALDIRRLYTALSKYVENEEHSVVSIDTEWHDDDNGFPCVATLQLAVPRDMGRSADAWVVDMAGFHETEYHVEVVKLIQWLFEDSDCVILGFAFGHDLPKMNAYLRTHNGEPISMKAVVDMQNVAAYHVAARTTQTRMAALPSLKRTCAQYLDNGNASFALDKAEQCSDWSQRPLRPSQLEYAGLDATVLLVLLSEMALYLVDE